MMLSEWVFTGGRLRRREWVLAECPSCRAERYVRPGTARRSTRCLSCANGRRVCHELPGRVYSKLSQAARDAIRRCSDPLNRAYGGRGISVYPQWVEDYTLFIVYLASLPGSHDASLVLDRIDNDEGYRPGNLRWVTPLESVRNRRCVAPSSYAEGAPVLC